MYEVVFEFENKEYGYVWVNASLSLECMHAPL